MAVTTAEQGPDKHLRDYWNILRKRMRQIIAIFCGTVALGLIFNFFSPTLYLAKSTLKIEPQNPTVSGVRGVEGTLSDQGASPYDYYQTQFVLLKSRPLVARVIKNLGLASNPAFKDSSNIFQWTYKWIVGSIVGGVNSISRFVKGESRRAAAPKVLPMNLEFLLT